MSVMKDLVTVILAGGRGTRLEPLTRDRAKPAVPFGGQYRIIDFVLSNCFNSGARRIFVLTQYKSFSLDRHIATAWRFLHRDVGEFIESIPPQQRINEQWYAGTADAIYQNVYSIEQENPKHVLILGGDHIYKMNYNQMLNCHLENDADLTIACLPLPISEGHKFGVLEVDASGRVIGFEEKPRDPKPIPGQPDTIMASMGIYIFKSDVMYERLCQDAGDPASQRDFGKNVIPNMIKQDRVFAYGFKDENKKSAAYWRDVGTIEDYYSANMDLIEIDPTLDLYDSSWPIRTSHVQMPPAKFVFNEFGEIGHVRRGEAHDSIICQGSIISGALVERSVLGRKVLVEERTQISNSIIFDSVRIGANCQIQNAIIDKDVVIPPNSRIGFDLELEQRRGFMVSANGITVIGKGETIS